MLMAIPAFAADTIKIGEIATLTGDFAAFGEAEVQAIKLAVKEINANGGILGKKAEVIMYDCRTRNEDMVNAARRLVTQDNVCAVIGPSGSGLCIAASPVFTKAEVPHIGTMPTNINVTHGPDGKVKPYNFRICFIDPYQGKLLAYLAGKEFKAKTAAILYDVSSDYSHGIRDYFKQNFPKYGGKIVADEAHRGDDVDFRAQLTTIKNLNPDVLIIPTMGKVLPLAVKQAREMGFTVPIIGGDGFGDYMWEITGKEAMKNTFWASHVDQADPALKKFFADYKKIAGTECQEFMNAVTAYDSVYWLKNAIERAKSTDPKKITKALAETKNLRLMHCVLTMDQFHDPKDKDGVVVEGKDGKFVFYKKIKP